MQRDEVAVVANLTLPVAAQAAESGDEHGVLGGSRKTGSDRISRFSERMRLFG